MIDKYFGLHGKTAMVTGASQGLGRAIAIGMAEAGANVITVSRNVKRLEETVDGIRSLGREALVIQTDIGNADEVKETVDREVDSFGTIGSYYSSVYSMTKAAVIQMTRNLALERTRPGNIFFCSRKPRERCDNESA